MLSSSPEAQRSFRAPAITQSARLMSTQFVAGDFTVAISCSRTERRSNIEGMGWLNAILATEGALASLELQAATEALVRELANLVSPALAVNVIVINNLSGRRSKVYSFVMEGY